MYLSSLLFLTSPNPKDTETIPEAKYENMVPNRILKRGSDESLDNFLGTIQKLLNKKRGLINVSKRKQSISKQKLKIVVISSLDNLDKEDFKLISTLISIFGTNIFDIVIIDADTHYLACKLKRAQVFAVSIRDLESQVKRKARPETKPKIVVPEEYYDLLDVFSKKNPDILLLYQKQNHKIILEEEQKYGRIFLYEISIQELNIVKRYLDLHLANGFI